MEGTMATGAVGELPASPTCSQLQKLLQQMSLERDELQTQLTQAQVSAHTLYKACIMILMKQLRVWGQVHVLPSQCTLL